MPRSVCPHCKTVVKVKYDQAGEKISCPKCSNRFMLRRRPSRNSEDRTEVITVDELPFPVKDKGSRKSADDRGRASKKTSPKRGADSDPKAIQREEDERRRNSLEADFFKTDTEELPKSKRADAKTFESDFFQNPAELAAEIEDDADDETESKGGSFAASVGGFLIIAVILVVLTGKWWIRLLLDVITDALQKQGIPPIVAIAGAVALVAIPAALLWVGFVKSSIVSALPVDLDFRAVKPSEFKGLDAEQLAKRTAAAEKLGFRLLTDYSVRTELEGASGGFARLMVHDRDHVFAEINQGFQCGHPAGPMRCMVMSLLHGGWSVCVTDRAPSKESYLLRLPQAVWRSMPDAPFPKLMDDFKRLRNQMMGDLSVGVSDVDTAESYFAREKSNARQRKDRLRKRWAIAIQLEFWLFERFPKRQWLGEYRRYAR